MKTSLSAFSFPFVYVGGGYFRRMGVPIGEVAETLHGNEVVDYIANHLGPPLTQSPTKEYKPNHGGYPDHSFSFFTSRF